jgi:hypothetical protein
VGPVGLDHIYVPAQAWELYYDRKIMEKTRMITMKYLYKGYG